MGWSIGYDRRWKRDVGYGVPATCDYPGCNAEINRGLAYVCGGEPYGGEHGCGLYFCDAHQLIAGDRRNNVQLCSRCYGGRGGPYKPTPDTPEWIHHKLTDESWKRWRETNVHEVAQLVSKLAKQPFTGARAASQEGPTP